MGEDPDREDQSEPANRSDAEAPPEPPESDASDDPDAEADRDASDDPDAETDRDASDDPDAEADRDASDDPDAETDRDGSRDVSTTEGSETDGSETDAPDDEADRSDPSDTDSEIDPGTESSDESPEESSDESPEESADRDHTSLLESGTRSRSESGSSGSESASDTEDAETADDVDDDDDADADDDVDDENDADADDDGESTTGDRREISDEEYERQLEEAKIANPPLSREEAEKRREEFGRDDDSDGDDENDGDGPATAAAEAGSTEVNTEPYGDDGEGVMPLEGPETDEEMPLAVHIEEMMRRLGVVFLFGGIATLIAFPYASELINYFWSYHIPEPGVNRPRLYGPLELILTRLKVAGLAGVVIGLPVLVYQSYLFMRPGLYENERRYYLAAVPTSLILGSIGVMFAHFLVLPAIFSYFTAYTEGAAVIAFGLAETFNLMVVMMAFMAIVFQIPLFIMLAIMMDIVTRRWLEQKRLIFWGAFLGIAFIFSPDPTGMAPIIVTLTMIVLYEGTLALLRWTGN